MAGVHLPHDGEGRDDAVMHAREGSVFLSTDAWDVANALSDHHCRPKCRGLRPA